MQFASETASLPPKTYRIDKLTLISSQKGTPAFSGRAVGENDVDERDEPLLKERFPAVEGEDIPPYRTPTHHIVPQDPPAKGKNARGVVNDEGIGPVTGEGTVRDDIFPREAEANPVMGDEPGPYDDKRSAVLEDEPGPYGDK